MPASWTREPVCRAWHHYSVLPWSVASMNSVYFTSIFLYAEYVPATWHRKLNLKAPVRAKTCHCQKPDYLSRTIKMTIIRLFCRIVLDTVLIYQSRRPVRCSTDDARKNSPDTGVFIPLGSMEWDVALTPLGKHCDSAKVSSSRAAK